MISDLLIGMFVLLYPKQKIYIRNKNIESNAPAILKLVKVCHLDQRNSKMHLWAPYFDFWFTVGPNRFVPDTFLIWHAKMAVIFAWNSTHFLFSMK